MSGADEQRDGQPDGEIDRAFAAWRAATESVAPSAELLARIERATQPMAPSLAASVWRLGSRAAVGLALAAALLFVAARQSIQRLDERAAVTMEALLP